MLTINFLVKLLHRFGNHLLLFIHGKWQMRDREREFRARITVSRCKCLTYLCLYLCTIATHTTQWIDERLREWESEWVNGNGDREREERERKMKIASRDSEGMRGNECWALHNNECSFFTIHNRTIIAFKSIHKMYFENGARVCLCSSSITHIDGV